MPFHRSLAIAGSFVALMSAAQPAAALDKCKAKINSKDGTILVSASDVTGTLKWGATSAAVTQTFFDSACVADGKAKNCVLGDVGTETRIVPPRLCTLHLADDSGTCSAYLKGCTPASAGSAPPNTFQTVFNEALLDCSLEDCFEIAISAVCPVGSLRMGVPICSVSGGTLMGGEFIIPIDDPQRMGCVMNVSPSAQFVSAVATIHCISGEGLEP